MNRFLLLLPLIAALLLGSCKKDKVAPKDQLPPATTSGANTFGCLVNGELWKVETASQLVADWTTSDVLYFVAGFNSKDGYKKISLIFPDTTHAFAQKSGVQALVKSGVNGNYASLWPPNKYYGPEKLVSGTVNLSRLDYHAGIIAGTFSFVMAGGPGDTVRVTEGRFDIGNMDR